MSSWKLSSWLWPPKSARILVLGRVNSGKSALINAMLDDRRAAEGEAIFESPITTKVQNHELTYRGVPVTVFDTPGLRGAETEGDTSSITEILKSSGEFDLVVYCCRLDRSIAGIDIDYEIILQLKANMSSSVWSNVVFALTFANKVDESDGPISNRVYSFGQRLCECVSRSGVDLQVASAIPFVPAGYGKDDTIPGHENWLENFWDVCIPRMKDQPKTTTLKGTIRAVSPPIPSYLREWLSQTTSASILITGKTGTGKSSLINGMVGKIVAKEGNTLERETTSVQQFRVACEEGVTITVWDSPGLQDGLDKEDEYIKDMQSKGLASADLVFYCQRMNETRMMLDDSKAIRKLTDGLGKSFWANTVFVLTFANYTRPTPNQEYRSLSEKDKGKRNVEFFNGRLEEWKKHLQKAVREAGVEPGVAEKIPVVAAGYEADQTLPGCDNWLSNLWVTSIERMKENSQPVLLKANLRRLMSPNQAKSEDFNKPLHEQPILYKPVVRYGTAPLVITALGILVGAAAAGPVGAVAAGAVGAGAGGVIDSVIAWFDSWRLKPTTTSEASDSAPNSDPSKQDEQKQ